MSLLLKLIKEDFGISGSGRWWRSDVHSSLILDVEKNIFYFNAEGIVGNEFIYLTRVRGYSESQAKDYLREYKDYDDTFIHRVKNQQEWTVYPKLIDVFYEKGLHEDTSYWTNRGLTLETIGRHRLGYTGEFFTIPIYEDGIFKNFQLRRDGPKTMRYYYPDHTTYLYNSDILKLTNSIIITEGLTDCLALLQAGVPCVGCPSSNSWQDEWCRHFIYQKHITVIFDNDNAGRIGAVKVAKALGVYRTKIYTFNGFEDKYDLTDYFKYGGTVDGLKELVTNNAKYSFE